jgi:hypothetical protein
MKEIKRETLGCGEYVVAEHTRTKEGMKWEINELILLRT